MAVTPYQRLTQTAAGKQTRKESKTLDIHTALEVAKNPGHASYRQALEFLVDRRADLRQRVYIVLPGGLSGNSDLAWHKVRTGSDQRCSCGNERVIVPLIQREQFQSSQKTVLVSESVAVYIRPIGGDRESCYMKVEIVKGVLTFRSEPFASFVLTTNLFTRKEYPLAQLQRLVDRKPTMYTNKRKTPLFQIVEVDLAAGTLTIDLDMDVETFDPDKEKPRHS